MSEAASVNADGNGGNHLPANSPHSSEDVCSHTPPTPPSKNALRKLRRQQWLQEAKDRRRALRADAKRLKKKLKREAAAVSNKEGGLLEEQQEDAGLTVRICVDCAFEDFQGESEIFSLVQQLMYAYGDANRLNRQRDKANGTRRRWKSGWRSKTAKPSTTTDATENCADDVKATESCTASKPSSSSSSSTTQPGSTQDCMHMQSVALPDADKDALPSESSLGPGDSNTMKHMRESICTDSVTAETQPAVDFCITGIGPKVMEALKRVQCNGRWKCDVCAVSFEEKFAEKCAEGKAVYLTADAEEELDTLDPSTVYIVGGLVDRNRYKGLTLNRSKERGVKAAKLPIASKLGRKLEGSKILTVNQVVSILIAFAELGNWTSALNRVLPPRKGALNSTEKNEESLENNILLNT